jgi:serine/threonine-protein kinase
MSPDKPFPAHFGRYQVLEELGAGAMGVVYLCVDPRLNRPVAIKVLRVPDALSSTERQEYEARFRQEAEAAGRLNHPDIVQIYDIGPSYLVMEFLEGQTLAAHLRNGASLTVRHACSLVLRVADALDYAHRHGIVHRDVKPANVMLMSDGGVKVMDFGVARLDSSTLTMAGAVVGSVRYMAPEQMMGHKVDGRADVFSLAAVAYELLTGSAPFPGKTITEVVSRVVRGGHVPPRQVDERLPEPLNAVFARAFAPRPADRHAHAVELARDLHAASEPGLDLTIVHRSAQAATHVNILAPTIRGAAFRPGDTVLLESTPAPDHTEAVLLLDSDPPGARVHVDGNPVGNAPIASLSVSFGRHVVRMEADGREAVSAEVEVRRERPLKAVTFTLPPPAPPDGAVRSGQLVAFGPGVSPPVRRSGTPPAYPDAARERGMEGSPVVEVWVSETGDVIDVAILESAGAILDGALLEAVAGWRFRPATLRGVPVCVRLTVQHLFRR